MELKKKSDLTGSITSLQPKILIREQLQVQLIQGRTSGVVVTQSGTR
jgi:hypothetical protein